VVSITETPVADGSVAGAGLNLALMFYGPDLAFEIKYFLKEPYSPLLGRSAAYLL
jgi:hypothetical protein